MRTIQKTPVVTGIVLVLLVCGTAIAQSDLVQVHENFSADPGWEGMNNRVEASNPPTIRQDFGWNGKGEIGGTAWRSRTIAYYALPFAKPLTFKDPFSASGTIRLMPAEKIGGVYIGFFNHERQEWRPWSSMAFRLGDYVRGAEMHLDYMTATWRANGVRLPVVLPADGSQHRWKMDYDPNATIDPKWPAEGLEASLTNRREPEDQIFQRAAKTEPGLTREQLRQRLEKAREQGLVGVSRIGDHDEWWKSENLGSFRGAFTFQLDDGPPYRMFLTKEDQDEPVIIDRFGIFNFQLYGRHWEF